MKAFAAAALATVAAASAAPEAEPWLGYAAPPTGHAVAGLVTHPDGSVTPPYTPAVAAAAADHLHVKAATYAAHGYGLPLAGLWKREADAEAEPWLGGFGPLGLAHPKSAPCVNAWNIPVACGKKKRDAEAEPWLGYGAPWAVGSPVAGLVAHPNGAVTPPYTPAQQAVAADHFAAKWGKRDADAEAEPWLGGFGPYGLAGPKNAPCVNAWNVPVPCGGKKKRDAEAEPWLGYGYAPAVGSPVAGLVAHPNGAVTPPYTPAQQAVAADHFAAKGGLWWGKRSAEAEPWLGYGLGGWGLGGFGPLGLAGPKSAPCVNAWNHPVPC